MKIFIAVATMLIIGSGLVLIFRHEAEAPTNRDVQEVETIVITEGTFSLKVHETKVIPDAKITLSKVVEDSRCPSGVQCIWAGTAKVEIIIITIKGTSTQQIELGKNIMIGNNKLTFTQLLLYPQAGQEITDDKYEAQFTYGNK